MKLKFAAAFLIFIGLAQLSGDLLRLPALKLLGIVSHASPAPKVFTTQNGFETYSANFYIDWTDFNGKSHNLHITPYIYKQVIGPYNRRNAYGAALSYAPVLYLNPNTKPMLMSVMQYAFCKKTSILSEIGINPKQVNKLQLRLEPRQKLPENHPWKLIYEFDCA